MPRSSSSVTLAFGLLLGTAAPALAADNMCAVAPSQLRSAAASAEASVAKKALSYVSIGEKLCVAGNDRAAGKKFAAAMKALNIEAASLTAIAAAK